MAGPRSMVSSLMPNSLPMSGPDLAVGRASHLTHGGQRSGSHNQAMIGLRTFHIPVASDLRAPELLGPADSLAAEEHRRTSHDLTGPPARRGAGSRRLRRRLVLVGSNRA